MSNIPLSHTLFSLVSRVGLAALKGTIVCMKSHCSVPKIPVNNIPRVLPGIGLLNATKLLVIIALFKNELGSGASFAPRRLLGSLLGTELVVCKRNEANLNCLHRYSATNC